MEQDRVLLRLLVSRQHGNYVEWTGPELVRQAEEAAARYSDVPEGCVVLLLLPHCKELFLLHVGLVLSGRLPAILAWPTNRVDPEKYQRNLLHQLQNLPAAQLLTLPRLTANLDPGLPYRVTSCPIEGAETHEKSFSATLDVESVPKRIPTAAAAGTPPEALFLQFSGGTTGAQKCVVVTAPMLEDQLDRLSEVLAFTPQDGVASWLPMYHDMGLIACLWLPLWVGAPSLQFSASDWLLEPDVLFRELERWRATFCWLPNFAFSYLAGARERMRGDYSLAHVRAFINCSEPVRLRSMDAFAQTFAGWGVRLDQCHASYAMAENVFAVTQTPLREKLVTFPRRNLLPAGAGASELLYDLFEDVYVASGKPLSSMQVRITSPSGAPCAPEEPGNIEIHSHCLFGGYWGNAGFQTHAFTHDGWYATGDYGFLSGDELFVIGRTKDIVIVGGQNVFPEDAETVANSVPGVYPGRVVAFGVEDEQQGTESLAIVAELRGEYSSQAATAVARDIQRLVLSSIGIAPRFVHVVPERWIVKSTAGKISRRETRQRFNEERAGMRPAVKGNG
ncbi:MAG: AMP-binding protein [Acidobacteria bacterium]|nr:AMP-binding protein [Acidobacteriota bacterium]